MKKMILLGAAAIMMASSASAQMSLVKDLAKKAGSSNPMDLVEVLDKIEPAFTNPESANDVLTWFTAGKAAFGIYDEMYKMKIMQQPVDDKMMSQALSAAYEYYQKALPLDSVVEMDKNGMPKLNKDGSKKVKTKYSKDIIGALTSHMGDIANAGNIYLQASDWENAAMAFGNYADIASSPFAIANGVAAADSTLSQVRFFQGYSQYQIKEYAGAYENFTKARKLGYTDNNIVDFQTSSLANLVQGMLDNNEFDKANNFIDNALKADPMNGTLHDIKGFTVELQNKDVDAALPYYRKATEVDPTYANAFFDVGRCLYLKAQKIIDDNPTATNADLIPKIKPIYDEAIPFLQKAVDLNTNPDDKKAKNVLDDILYKFEVMGVK
jgi:tetratricopeptide (TPR) repeat protein